MDKWSLPLADESATLRLGACLGATAAPGDVLLLEGDLGAGKTTLVRGLARGLGVAAAVTSPTFALLHELPGRLPLYHFDLYRISPEEIDAAGFSEYWDSGRGVCAIEWAERLGEDGYNFRPPQAVTVTLSHTSDDARLAVLSASGDGRAGLWVQSVQECLRSVEGAS